METIVEKFILQLESQLTERRIAISLEPAARAWLAAAVTIRSTAPVRWRGSSRARCGIRLTDEILFGQLEHGGTVRIGLDGDDLTFAFEAATPVA